jgi:hypothetical protein
MSYYLNTSKYADYVELHYFMYKAVCYNKLSYSNPIHHYQQYDQSLQKGILVVRERKVQSCAGISRWSQMSTMPQAKGKNIEQSTNSPTKHNVSTYMFSRWQKNH